jgi:hypothetical protein
VGIKDPTILETRCFRLPRERDDPFDRHVGLDGNAELHVISSIREWSDGRLARPAQRWPGGDARRSIDKLENLRS